MIVANRYKNCGDGTLESTTVAHNIGNLQMFVQGEFAAMPFTYDFRVDVLLTNRKPFIAKV
jgi:hypothetical protein